MPGTHPMSDLIRPEAIALLRRWAEVLAASLLTLAGLLLARSTPGIVSWVGWALAVLGVLAILGALQRLRFAAPGQGEGIVEIDEGEIRYFGPRGGGIVALDAILVLSLSADAAYWLVESLEGGILAIPRQAPGAEALFDAFASLPGFEMPSLLRVVAQGPAPHVRMIWRRAPRRPLT